MRVLHSALHCELSLCYCVTPLVILSDDGNRQAENGVETALKYLAQNNRANINKKSMVALTGDADKATQDSEYLMVVVLQLTDQHSTLQSVESWTP